MGIYTLKSHIRKKLASYSRNNKSWIGSSKLLWR